MKGKKIKKTKKNFFLWNLFKVNVTSCVKFSCEKKEKIKDNKTKYKSNNVTIYHVN